MKRSHAIAVVIALSLLGFLFGRATGDKPLEPSDQAVHDFPMPAVPPRGTVAPAAVRSLVVEIPSDGAAVDGSFDVEGRARTSGKPVNITVSNSSGGALVTAVAPIIADGETGFGRFSVRISLPSGTEGSGTVRTVWESKDGRMAAETVTRRVSFGGQETVSVLIYFPKTSGGAFDDCSNVLPVSRAVSAKGEAYRAALESLLAGPTAQEKGDGSFSAIPPGVRVKSVRVDAQGVATADFSSGLGKGVAGSCRVTSIRTQIESTMKQFLEIHSVVIAIDGRTEGILQP